MGMMSPVGMTSFRLRALGACVDMLVAVSWEGVFSKGMCNLFRRNDIEAVCEE